MLILNFIRGLSTLIHLHDVVPNQTLNAEKIINLYRCEKKAKKTSGLPGLEPLPLRS